MASDSPLEPEVLTRIKGFAAMNKLKKEALKVRGRGGLVVVMAAAWVHGSCWGSHCASHGAPVHVQHMPAS